MCVMHTFHVTPRVPLSNSWRQSSRSAWGRVPPDRLLKGLDASEHSSTIHRKETGAGGGGEHSSPARGKETVPRTYLLACPVLWENYKTGEVVEEVGCFSFLRRVSFLRCTLHPWSKLRRMDPTWIGSPFESSLPGFICKFCICPALCFKTG